MGLYSRVRRLYEMINIPNRVIDGTEPFPEDQQSIRNGISVEFRFGMIITCTLLAFWLIQYEEMYRSGIPEVKHSLYAIYPSRSSRDSYAYDSF
jgi:hypothetical protein